MLCPWEPAREVRRRAMSTQRKQYSAEFKARVALEALKGLKTVNGLASTYGVHPTQSAHWKHRLQKEMSEIFSVRRDKRERDQEALHAQLYQKIGQLKVELDWVKKNYRCKSRSAQEESAATDPHASRHGLPHSERDRTLFSWLVLPPA